MGKRLSWLALAASLGFASLARAEAAPQLGVDLDGCSDAAQVEAIVALELGALTAKGATLPAHATRVTARCSGGVAQIEVLDPLTAKRVHRSIGLTHVATSARARVLAIAIAELVSASWFELERARAVPKARDNPEAQAERAAVLSAVRKRAALWRVSLGVGPLLTLAPELHAPAFGGSMRLMLQSPWRPLLLVELSGVCSQRDVALGRISTTALSLAAAGLWHEQSGSFGAHAGIGARAGLGRIRGETDDAELARAADVTGPWLGPLLLLGGALELGAWGSLQLMGELGYALGSVRGAVDGERAVAIDGVWVNASLTLQIDL